MAYQDSETSASDARPIELYKFIGTYSAWYYTSYATAITFSGNTYTPIFIQRNQLKVGTQEDKENSLEISVPFSLEMVRNYAYQNAPPLLQLELYRVHEADPTDSVLLWKGRVTSFSVEGRTAKLKCPSLFSYILDGNAPAPRFQAPCNHVLYDARCGVDPSSHQHTTTISSVAANAIQVATLPFAENLLSAGVIFNTSGEQRMIISNVGTSILVTYPFSNLNFGDSVTLRKGCDHAFEGSCKNTFSNGARFGGFPIVPDKNPFTTSIT